MSWSAPNTHKELTESIARGWSWRSARFGLRAEHVAVLSAHCEPSMGLDREHDLSAAVIVSAERYAKRYMADGTRTPEPEMFTYFVATIGGGIPGRVHVAVTASGEIRWAAGEHDERWAKRSDLAAAVERLAKSYAERDDWS